MMIETTPSRSVALLVLLAPIVVILNASGIHGFPTTLTSSTRRNPSTCSSPLFVSRQRCLVSLASSKQQDQQQHPPPPPPLDFEIQSSVLKQLYPSLLGYVEKYGHPNIPLGTPEGNQCRMLRRLHIQKKLTTEEVEWLTTLDFNFNSLEDVYFEVDFDTMLETLLEYEAEFQTNYQIPKKYEPNPELGAWVTGIRRLYNNPSKYEDKKLHEDHVQKLNNIGFAWQSTRKCGSPFMTQYRDLKARCTEGGEAIHSIMEQEPKILKWIQAQQDVYQKGNLSETRTVYLSQLLENEDWMTATYE